MNIKNPADFTVNELKEKFRELNLLSSENKAELINRLHEADPSGGWTRLPEITETSHETAQEDGNEASNRPPVLAHYEQEIELYRREKELAERELLIARRELEFVREMKRL